MDAYDETLVSSLKREVTETKRVADDLEKKYHRAAEELDDVQSELEETKRKNAELEKKLEQALKVFWMTYKRSNIIFFKNSFD